LTRVSCSTFAIRFQLVAESYGAMEIFKASIKTVVLLDKGKWGIVLDFVLEESKLAGKEVLIDYDAVDDLNETGDSCLMIETSEVPWVKRGDTIKITIRDRARK